MSYLLILFSLLLAFLGTYTETYKEIDNKGKTKRKLTIWGYTIGLLLLVSTAINIYMEHVSALAEQKKNEAYEKTISQQQFLSMLSIASNFSLADSPRIIFEYKYERDSAGWANDTNYYKTLKNFPGFGIPLDSFALDLNINDYRRFAFSRGGLPTTIDEGVASFDSTALNQDYTFIDDIQYTVEETNIGPDVNYIFQLAGYNSLVEVLSDFKSNRNIGSLLMFKKGKAFTQYDKRLIMKMYAEEHCFLNVVLKKDDLNSRLPHVNIPLHFKIDSFKKDVVVLSIVTGEPFMDSYQFVDD